eukprot:1142097-Pelagomonas_calceolata.AAC.7
MSIKLVRGNVTLAFFSVVCRPTLEFPSCYSNAKRSCRQNGTNVFSTCRLYSEHGLQVMFEENVFLVLCSSTKQGHSKARAPALLQQGLASELHALVNAEGMHLAERAQRILEIVQKIDHGLGCVLQAGKNVEMKGMCTKWMEVRKGKERVT